MFEEKTVFDVKRELDAGDPGGLSDREAKRRLSIYGKNELQEKKPPSVLKRLIGQFMDPLIYVLLAAGVISVLLGEQGDAAIIAAVVLLNAAVGVAQEGKAQKALDSLKKMTRLTAVVRRDGRILEVDSTVLVPGDLVLLSAGQQVPADLRLITAENLKTQESALTGESVPVEKDAGFLAGAHTPLGDRRNMLLSATVITGGNCTCVVTGTGMDTEVGRIAGMLMEEGDGETPLQRKMAEISKTLSFVCLCVCAVMFGLGLLQGKKMLDMFLTAVSLAVAAIPEGLAAVVTIVLSIGVTKMAAHFFVFYFGIVADITPPVALAAYAGSAIAKADPMKTGFNATKLAIAAFIVPYIFAFSPQMLFVDVTGAFQVVQICISALLGIFGVAAALNGFLYRPISPLLRLVLVVGGLGMLIPGTVTDVVGFVLVVGVVLYQKATAKRLAAA